MQYDTTIERTALERMLAAIAPEWRLEDATEMAAGHHPVYRLAVRTPEGDRKCYLKATPPGKDPSVDLEARLLAAIDAHSDIPVPGVIGVVDDHDDLPAPFVLTTAMTGETRPRTSLAEMPDADLRSIARDVGRYLAALHSLDAVDAYGFLTRAGPSLDGGRPAGGFDAVAVVDPVDSWPERLGEWADETLDALAETRFADVAPEARPVLAAQVDAVEGPFSPSLARVDQSLENGLIADGRLTAMLDWEFTIAATPAYDVCCVAWSLAGGPYRFAPGVSDRRTMVREALLDGYTDRGPDVRGQVRANRSCYDLLSALRSMYHLEDWYETFDLGDGIDDAAAGLRAEVDATLRDLQ